MNLKHVFKSECPNVEELFGNCDTLDAYITNLRKQVVQTDNYVNHGFEALIEALIKCEKKAIRISEYSSIASCHSNQNVAGKGQKSNGKNVTVMACFVNDPETSLTIHMGLASFISNSIDKFDIDVDEPKATRVFSNAKELDENTREQFFNNHMAGKLTTFYFKSDIEKLINGNQKFWLRFKNMMKINKTVFSANKKELRDYQKEACLVIANNVKGRVLLPTGTGKSVIAIHSILNEIEANKYKPLCFLIMTPRIVLTYQLLGEAIDYLNKKNIHPNFFNLNSGKYDDDTVKESMAEMGYPVKDIDSDTNPTIIKNWYDKSVKDNVPFIISATYQSAPRILSANIPIYMAIHDEAHNLVLGRFSKEIKEQVLKIEATKKFFFTATQALSDSDEGEGMNNESVYGKIIYHKSPKEMIDAGEIVPPYLTSVTIDEYRIRSSGVVNDLNDSDIENSSEFMAVIIEDAFVEHLKNVKRWSCAPEKIGAKMLVVCSGENTFSGFFESESFGLMKKNHKDIKFFGISSKFGAWINGEKVKPQGGRFKELFMLELKNLSPEDNAVILHIDMLGEGIDVPGITGVLPFRDMGTIKSCQTLGRAMRLVKEDRNSFYPPGTRSARDTKSMIKPFAEVIIPMYATAHNDIEEKMHELAELIRNEIGFNPFENAPLSENGKRHEDMELPNSGDNSPRPEEMKLIYRREDPYYKDLTIRMINDTVNGDEDIFGMIKTCKTLQLTK